MGLLAPTVTDERRMELAKFSRWMLDIGQGNIECRAKEGESEASWIQIPDEFLLKTTGDKVSCIISTIYPDLKKRYIELEYLKVRAILTPTNDVADTIKGDIVSLISEDKKQYLSCDTVVKAPNTHDSYDLLYTVEFLNSLNGNNFPPHKLCLKKGVPVMLLRNLNQAEGLCNRT
jgi:ATP-dependent DNA helicase PIF1